MFSEADRRLSEFASQWHGVFSAWHAGVLGLTPKQRKQRVADGVWRALHDEVYCSVATPVTWQGRLLAACWAGGFRSVASHRSAAALWALPGGRRTRPEITTPRGRRARHDGIIVHETRTLRDFDVTLFDGIPVTVPARTLVDLASVVHKSILEQAVDEALRRNLLSLADLWLYLEDVPGSGRRGLGMLRHIVATRRPGAEHAESIRESMVLRALQRAGLPSPVVQYEIRRPDGSFVARVDAAYPNRRIAIEYDSYLHHGGRRKFTTDLSRRNDLTTLGWAVVHVTVDDLRGGARRLIAALRPLLTEASRGACVAEGPLGA